MPFRVNNSILNEPRALPLSGVLPRAEWIKFLALFFNKEKEASQLYDWIQAQYQELKVCAGVLQGHPDGIERC